MTNAEALEWFKNELIDGKCSDTCEQCNANERALFALEKQIPKKPYYLQYDGNRKIGNYHCPACRIIVDLEPLDHDIKTFCLYCGQKLDWSDAE